MRKHSTTDMIPTQIQLRIGVTEGLGAGENPIVGEKSALESINDINAILKQGTKMVFITAGMGENRNRSCANNRTKSKRA